MVTRTCVVHLITTYNNVVAFLYIMLLYTLWCCYKISLWFILDIAGSLSLKAQGCDRFWLIASWKGRKPWTFCNEFLSFLMQVQYQGNTDCFLNLCSTFLTILNLCYSTSPLDHVHSAPAVCSLMLRACEQ